MNEDGPRSEPEIVPADEQKRRQWQAEKLMGRLVKLCEGFPPDVMMSVSAQFLYDLAQYHGAGMDHIAKLMVTVHHSRLQMADAEAKRVLAP